MPGCLWHKRLCNLPIHKNQPGKYFERNLSTATKKPFFLSFPFSLSLSFSSTRSLRVHVVGILHTDNANIKSRKFIQTEWTVICSSSSLPTISASLYRIEFLTDVNRNVRNLHRKALPKGSKMDFKFSFDGVSAHVRKWRDYVVLVRIALRFPCKK